MHDLCWNLQDRRRKKCSFPTESLVDHRQICRDFLNDEEKYSSTMSNFPTNTFIVCTSRTTRKRSSTDSTITSSSCSSEIRLNVSYNPKEIQYRLDNYFKFMFVRDAFERLVSAHRELFVKLNIPYRKTHERRINRMCRTNATNESLTVGSDVTF